MKSRVQIENTVNALLRKHGVCQPPVPVDEISKAEDIQIVEASLRADVSGALLRKNGVSGIAVNGAHPYTRRRFTIAHELAHHFLNHQGEADHLDWQFTVIRRDGSSSDATDVNEMEANLFAASLLMPRELLRADVEEHCRFNGELSLSEEDIARLAQKYVVSTSAMRYRLMNLALLSPA